MRKIRLLAAGLLALAFAAAAVSCATGGGAPSGEGWIGGEDPRYPSSAFLTAVGTGSSLEEASSNASAALASIFRQDIQSRTVAASSEQVFDGKAASQSSFDAASLVNVAIEDLAGLRIAESCEKGGVWRALAVMDRRQASSIYSGRAGEAFALIQSVLLDLEAAPPTFANYQRAMDLYPVFDGMLDDLAILEVVDPAAASMAPRLGRARIDEAARRMRGGLVCALRVEGAQGAAMESALLGFLSSKGFAISDADADRLVTARLDIEHSGEGGFLYANWEFSIKIADPATGACDLAWRSTGRKGGITESRADDMAIRAILKGLEEEWPGSI